MPANAFIQWSEFSKYKEETMTMHFTKQRSFRPAAEQLTETSLYLVKAQNGEIPIATLENIKLDQKEVSLFLAREMVFWYSAAEGAKMHLVATLFYELHKSLLASTKSQKA
jgi:hypothetical protein